MPWIAGLFDSGIEQAGSAMPASVQIRHGDPQSQLSLPQRLRRPAATPAHWYEPSHPGQATR
ncbi:MAG: hypothetical protein ACREXO_21125 [Advenella sp.]